MYKNIFIGLIFVSVLAVACNEKQLIQATEWPVQEPTPPVPDPPPGDIEPIAALNNPDRGFHVEVDYFLHNLKEPWRDVYYPDGFVDEKLGTYRAENDGVTLTQMYIYLTEWTTRDIPQTGLNSLQTMFDKLKTDGQKAILRFAYKWDGEGSTSGSETPTWVERHLTQLKPLLQQNLGLIAAMQAGFVGTWGEWHSSPMDNNQPAKNRVVNALMDAYPAPYCIEMRHPRYKNALTLQNESNRTRIGFANDYFTTGEHRLSPDNDFCFGDPAYIELKNESHTYYVSGEIPYSGSTDWEFNAIMKPENVVTTLRDHHYSAFDISQNFDLNISSWKRVKVYPAWLKQYKILFSDDYFKNDEQETVSRSFYDFVRDHLGYRLNLLDSSKITAEGSTLKYDLKLSNTGFATVLNPKPVYLVFINESNSVVKEILLTDVNPHDWQPFDPAVKSYEALIHSISGSVNTALSGKHKVGIWIPDGQSPLVHNNRYDLKFAPSDLVSHWTDAESKYTVNVIGELVF
ncbi:MAG: DUF4874 domain-containing protein [Prevotellaceae bacterium]|jgi:hypothetical protein|nr:DUF4874 domain-containing protein [Prevotellaceae bacterium]